MTELDRLGRSTNGVITMMDDLTKRSAVLRVLSMPSLDIRSDDRRLIAIWTRPLRDWARLWFWQWMP